MKYRIEFKYAKLDRFPFWATVFADGSAIQCLCGDSWEDCTTRAKEWIAKYRERQNEPITIPEPIEMD